MTESLHTDFWSLAYQTLSTVSSPAQLRGQMVKLYCQCLGHKKFILFSITPNNHELTAYPESPETFASMGLDIQYKHIRSSLESSLLDFTKTESYVLLPLFLRNEAIGGLLLSRLEPKTQNSLILLNKIFSNFIDKLELQKSNALLAEKLDKAQLQLETIKKIAQAVTHVGDIRQLLSLVLKTALDLVQGGRGFIMLQNEQTGQMEVRVASGLPNPLAAELINTGKLVMAPLPQNEGIQGRVLQSGKAVLLQRQQGEFEEILGMDRGANSIMCVPLMVKSKAFGVLYIGNETHLDPFTQNELDVLTILSAYVSSAVDQARLYTLATTDELTGLYTRRFFTAKLAEESRRAERYKRSLTLLIIDIDHFKNVNDTFGHETGDHVLKSVALTLRTLLRQNIDTAVRMGGEEFAVLLPETPLQGGYTVAERIRSQVEAHKYSFRNEVYQVTISIGLTAYPENQTKIEELLNLADQALYQAKAEGRNKVVSFPLLRD